MATDTSGQVGRGPRRGFWLLTLFWMVGTATYWWHRIPIEPELVIPLQSRTRAWGNTARGDFVISHGRQGRPSDIQRTGGPVDIVSSTTGEVLAQRLREGDSILAVSDRHIVGADREEIRIVELEAGKIAFSLPAGTSYPCAAFSFDAERLAIARGSEIAMYSVETGEQLWNRKLTKPPHVPLALQGDRVGLFMSFQSVLSVSFGFQTHEYLRAADGQRDLRFGPHDHVDESHDGSLAIVARGVEEVTNGPAFLSGGLPVKGRTVRVSDKDQFVYDLAESRPLWEMKGEVNWRGISPDSKEIWEFSSLAGQPTLQRWRAEDGKPIVQQDSPLQRKAYGGIASHDARFLLTWVHAPGLRAPAWLRTLCSNLGTAWNGQILPAQEELVLIDQRTGNTRLVLAPSGSKQDERWLQNLTGGLPVPERFTVHQKDRILVYCFDAPRNWLWLLCAGPGVVLLVLGLSKVWTFFTQRPLSPSARVSNTGG